MGEGDGLIQVKELTFEEKLAKYKHRMEFIRTLIGFVVLTIQLFILYHLYAQ